MRGSTWCRQTLIYLVRIPHRLGHSNQRVVLTGSGHVLAQATASTDFFELAQAGGISSCIVQLGSNNHYRILVCEVSFFFTLICDFSYLRRIFLADSARPRLT
jgi:hypothetical protein